MFLIKMDTHSLLEQRGGRSCAEEMAPSCLITEVTPTQGLLLMLMADPSRINDPGHQD